MADFRCDGEATGRACEVPQRRSAFPWRVCDVPWLVATTLERDDRRAAAGRITVVAPTLWAEGLDRPVQEALERKVSAGVAGALEALQDFENRGFGSGIFRAVVRRLAEELAEDMQRAYLASLN